MKTALVLIYLTFIAALLASTTDRSTATWGVLAAAFVALLVAAIVRVIVVTNASEEEPS